LLLTLGVTLLAGITDYASVVVAVALLGLGEGASAGTSQVFAMDLSPEGRRGAFLGVWTLFQSLGGLLAPLAVGGIAKTFGYGIAFYSVAVWLVLALLLMWWWGPETGGRGRRAAVAAAT
jgi:MFS family permease